MNYKLPLICILNIFYIGIIHPFNFHVPAQVPKDHSKRKTSYPYISGDTFRAFADHIFDETHPHLDTNKINHGDTIFLNTEGIDYFFKTYHPKINVRYILITHNSDLPAPGPAKQYLNDPKLIHWFGQNPDIDNHPKFTPIPIGLANSHWTHGNINTLDTVKNSLPAQKNNNQIAYLNILLNTFQERPFVYNYFVNKPFVYKASRKSHIEYLKEMSQYKFVISPRGNGLDCHRTWESLLIGCIPIVKHSPLDAIFKDLPVLLINKWEDVDKNLLVTKYNEIKSQTYKQEKLFADYWFNNINKLKNTIG